MVEKFAINGKDDPEIKGKGRFDITENQMTLIRLDGSAGRRMDLRIHPGGAKGTIDIRTIETDWEAGIYKLEGDTLTLCFAKDRKPRPAKIEMSPETFFLELKREKKK